MYSIFGSPPDGTTSVPSTSVPTPSAPPTAVPPTAVPPTTAPAASEPQTPAAAKRLTAKQELALAALLKAPTLEAAAKTAGLSSITLWRYMKQPEFREAYQEARREVVGQTITQLQRSSLEAVKTLTAISMNETAASTARVSAAKAILEMSLRTVEMEEIQARVEALEESVREVDG